MRQYGYLLDLKDEASWLYVFGIFCAWVSIGTMAHSLWQRAVTTVITAMHQRRGHKNIVAKLTILTDRQRYYLAFVKVKGTRQFQAWDNDETIAALRRMGLIVGHEETDDVHSRYEVPHYVWDAIPEPSDEQKSRFLAEAPWHNALRASRI